MTQAIAQALAPFFAEQDAKLAAADLEWAMGRVQALREFKQTAEYAGLNKKGAWGGVYDRLFAIAGGKTWYSAFEGRSLSMIEELMAKNSASVAKARNAKIAAKLAKAGVTEVTSAEVGYCKDGFNGYFRVNGDKMVIIDSILAGGYNIQRLHQRGLVTVR